ncbi:MAG TPA: hypothetical protein VK787_15350, partial [Puia sp.]|nr:hypothetical protein [Puia sp.]
AAVNDSSYTVAGDALTALSKIDSAAAIEQAKKLSSAPAKGELKYALLSNSDETKFDEIYNNYAALAFGNEQFFTIKPFAHFLGNVKSTDKVKKGVDLLVKIRGDIPQQYHSFTDPEINGALKELMQKKQGASLMDQSDYIKSKLPADTK